VQHNPAARLADTAGLSQDDRIEVELDRIVSGSVSTPITLPPGITRRLDRVLLHPWLGLPLFFITVFLLFQLVYGIGTPLQNGMNWGLAQIKTDLLQPALAHAPLPLQSFIQDGLFNGIGTVLSFLPIIVVFFMFMAIIEDSGYLARAAYLMDAIMARLGLDGRSFVMQLMGFGCNVPALMGTRVMRSRALRLLTMMVIPFSLCSARLQVFLFFTTAIFAPRAAAMVMFSLYLMSFLMAFLTALVWRGKYRSVEPLLLELPPYRFPTFKQLIAQGWQQSQHFLKGALGLHRRRGHCGVGVNALSIQRTARQPRYLGRPIGRFHGTLVPAIGYRSIVIGGVAIRLHRQRNRDRCSGGNLRRWPVQSGGYHRRQAGLGTGLQFYAVHTDLYAVPVHRGGAQAGIEKLVVYPAGSRLATRPGLAGELHFLPERARFGLVMS